MKTDEELAALEKRRNEVCDKMKNWVDKEASRSYNQLGSTVGVNASILSQLRRNVYPGDVEGVISKIESWFSIEDERISLDINPGFVLTRQSKKINRLIISCHVLKSIGVIISSSGLGKTRTLQHYAEKNEGTYYIKAHPFMRSKGGFLHSLCSAFGIPPATNFIKSYEKLIAEASTRGALIIIDDAQTLTKDDATSDKSTLYEIIRAINDEGVGIVLAGNSRLRNRVTETQNAEFYQQFASRSKILVLDEEISESDMADVLLSYFDGHLKKAEFAYLFEVANNYYGSLRIALNILTESVLQAKAKKSELSLELLKNNSKLIIAQRKKTNTGVPNGTTIKKKERNNSDNNYAAREKGSTPANDQEEQGDSPVRRIA